MLSQSKCQFNGELPQFGETSMCDSCHKLRSPGQILRCQIKGPQIEGLGDVVAKVTRATGIAQAVEFVTGGECGCPHRQAALNRMFHIGQEPPTE